MAKKSKTKPQEIPTIQLSAEALAFLRDVMLGIELEAKTMIIKSTSKEKTAGNESYDESYRAETFYIPAELETRMKAAERLLKYDQERIKKDEDEKQYGIVILPAIEDNKNE